MVDRTRKDEEIVAQAVDISDYITVDCDVGRKAYYASFGASRHASGDMSACRILTSSWEDEAVVSRKRVVEAVDGMFDFRDSAGSERLGLPTAFGLCGKH